MHLTEAKHSAAACVRHTGIYSVPTGCRGSISQSSAMCLESAMYLLLPVPFTSLPFLDLHHTLDGTLAQHRG